MASTINGTSTGSGGLISTGDDSGILNIQTNETTAITVDASQNVGIGTASPTALLDVAATAPVIKTTGTTGTSFYRANNTGGSFYVGIDSSTGGTFGVGNYSRALYSSGAYPMVFFTNDTERMRIDSSGNVLVGTTGISTGTFKGIQCGVNSGGFPNYLSNNPAGTANRNWSFGMNNSDQYAVYGYNTTTFNSGAYIAWGGTSWTASSDERKKDIIEPIENGLQKVSTLRAVIGKYKTDEEGTRRSFLIAQDVQAVLPEAVDASNPDDLGVQYTEVIPLLVSAIKELKAINDTQAETINALTARIVALESKA